MVNCGVCEGSTPALQLSLLQDVQCSDSGDGLGATLHVELATDIEDVFLHCIDAQDQVLCDLAVGRPDYH